MLKTGSLEMAKINHGMVLAAGLGKRMRPVTNTLPKPLVRVHGETILDRNIAALKQHRVENIVVNGHYLLPVLKSHLQATYDKTVHLSEEPTLLDQGGGIKAALPHLGDGSFFVLNGDAFWSGDKHAPNLARLEAAWNPADMDFLLLVCPKERATGFDGAGDFYLNEDNRISFREERETAPYVFTGVGIYARHPFENEPDEVFPTVPIFKKSMAEGRLFGLTLEGRWFHIGTPAAIGEAESAMVELGLAASPPAGRE
jgi:MurNAc alpha-1-phosphate uridylyltransferase